MNRAPLRIALVLSAALQASCVVQRAGGPMLVPLHWSPTDDARLPLSAIEGLRAQRIYVGPFIDVRQDRRLIGQNIEARISALPKPVWTVSTNDDVGAFLSARFRSVLTENGLTPVASGATRVITAEVERFFVNEGETYKADVALKFTVGDDQGRTLWQGFGEGRSNRWGRSYNLDNYYESLSNAFLEATKSLLQNPDFVRAMSG